MTMLMATQSPRVILPLTIILALLDMGVVLLRFYARNRRKQGLRVDDWLTIPALVLNIGLAATMIHGVAKHVYGYPTPVATESPPTSRMSRRTSWSDFNDNITIAQKDEWIFLLISIPALGCIKLSILFFYQRLFVISKRDWRDFTNLTIWSMIVLVTMWTLAFFLRYLFACGVNFSIWWTNAMNIMTLCGDFNLILNALAVSDFVCDLILLIIPVPTIWKLHMPTSQKTTVTFVFALGGFATIASVIRMIWVLWQAKQNFNPDLDVDLLITTFLFWNYLEATTALLAACLPTLRGLVRSSSLDSKLQSIRNRIQLTSKTSKVSIASSIRRAGRRDQEFIMGSHDSGKGVTTSSVDSGGPIM